MKFTRIGFKVTVTAEDSAVDNIINKIFSGNTQREMPIFTEDAFEEPEAIEEQDIFSEYEESYRVAAYYNAVEVTTAVDTVSEPVVVIFGVVNSEQHDNNTTTIKEEKTMRKTLKLSEELVSIMLDFVQSDDTYRYLSEDAYDTINRYCMAESDDGEEPLDSPLNEYAYQDWREYHITNSMVEDLMRAADVYCIYDLYHYFDKDTAADATQGITDEQEAVNMTEQVENELTVLEAAEQYADKLIAGAKTYLDALISYYYGDIAEDDEQDVVDEQEEVNMTEQVNNESTITEEGIDMTEQAVEYMTVLEAAEQYVAESREAESSGQVEDAAALRRADSSFTITDEHAADLRNWFYRTFKEFVDCEVDTKLLVNLYKMRLRATECTLNFEQYLRRYAYDLLMFNAGIVDESMPCFGDLKFINWLLTDDNAYPFIKLYVDAFNTAKVIRPVLSELICIFGGDQSQEQVEQSEEDLLMNLNYDEYTMKMITEARRKQLAS